jgi:hypothetical protein
MWAAKLVGKSCERVTTLAARREIEKERKGHTQQRSDRLRISTDDLGG